MRGEHAGRASYMEEIKTTSYINASFPEGLLLHISSWHAEFSILNWFSHWPKDIKYGVKAYAASYVLAMARTGKLIFFP